jgi:hypothetical protein
MVIRDNAEIYWVWRKRANADARLLWMVFAAFLNIGAAQALPVAQPGQGAQSAQDGAAHGVIRTGFCPEDEPCPVQDPAFYPPRHVRRSDPEPGPYRRQEPDIVRATPDCAEERYAVQTHVTHEAAEPRRSAEPYDEPCGVKCWYHRLRAGYCGRGCDYYRFRMTQFPEGRLGDDQLRLACR